MDKKEVNQSRLADISVLTGSTAAANTTHINDESRFELYPESMIVEEDADMFQELAEDDDAADDDELPYPLEETRVLKRPEIYE